MRIGLHIDPPAGPGQTAGLCMLWALMAAAIVGLACYLRSLDGRRRAAVIGERRTQRLNLARDLHDFAAHDMTGVVVLAQAAQALAENDPRRACELLPEIEAIGLQALAAMDRTVQIFGDQGDATSAEDSPMPGGSGDLRDLRDLPTLSERFARTGKAAVRLDLGPDVSADLPAEVGAVGYRVVVEALTNVRRHAATATEVHISVTRTGRAADGEIRIMVTDDAHSAESAPGLAGRDRRHGGFGLAGLTERVEALGGELSAGPGHLRGWCVTAVIPLAVRSAAGAVRRESAERQIPAKTRRHHDRRHAENHQGVRGGGGGARITEEGR
ncbi:sensor histidine kinase [Actinoallomurus acanthiterrae]